MKWRNLEETLNPQPLASKVINQRLLRWIDAADRASQLGLPRPTFVTEDGGPIFPADGTEEELWWLADVKRKEDKRGDEDGPPESEEEEAEHDEVAVEPDALTEDSDPLSGGSDLELAPSQTVVLPTTDSQPHQPSLAWRR